jgi:PAS domain-containing protein/cytochrome c553
LLTLRNLFLTIVFALVVSATIPAAFAQQAAKPAAELRRSAASANFQRHIRPMLDTYCFSCHGNGKSKGDVVLDQWPDEATAVKDTELWQRVLAKVQNGEMPPDNKPQPSATDKQRLTQWVETKVFQCDCEHPDPGRTLVRRLNRNEYNNTIRDLLGVDFKPAEDFPIDDSGHGFDNIADALSLSPVLVEKYLAAAERIVNSALVMSVPASATNRFSVDELEVGYNARQRGDGWVRLNSVEEDDVAVDFHSAVPGEYAVRVHAYAEQQSSNAMQLTFMLGDQPVEMVTIETNAASPRAYETRLKLALGKNRVRAVVRRVKDGLPEEEALRWKSGPLQKGAVNVEWLEIEGPLVVDSPLPVTHQQIFFTESEIGTDREVARDILGRFARRAYRRPVTKDEVNRLVNLAGECWQRGDNFEQGIGRAIQAALVSPYFLFRSSPQSFTNTTTTAVKTKSETSQPRRPALPHESVREVDEFTLASRLSYFLWSSMPDERLFALAEKNLLRRNLESEVRRMLNHARSRALVENFAGQWLQIRNLEMVTPDDGQFPKFNEELRRAMRLETELLFANILQTDSSILQFLDADYTYVNESLAKLYGISGVKGRDFERVSLRGTPRRGVLTHASVLALTSNPTRTSPVKRGKWVLETLLNAPPPPPPPEVPELKEGKELTGTLRQRMEQHRADALCASCHARMDPIGFGLENFDAIGAWRDKDGKEPVDASGELSTGEQFRDALGLTKILAEQKKEQFVRAFADKMLIYALGRGTEYTDKCALDEITQSAAADDYRFSSVVMAIVKSTPFQKSRTTR